MRRVFHFTLARCARTLVFPAVLAIVVLAAPQTQAQAVPSTTGLTSSDILGMPAAGTLPGTSVGAMFGMHFGYLPVPSGNEGASVTPAARYDVGARLGFALSIADRLQLDLGFGGRLGMLQPPGGDAVATGSFDGFRPGIRAVLSGRRGGEIGPATALLFQAGIPLATLLGNSDDAGRLVLQPALMFDERRGRGQVGFYLGVPVVMTSTGDAVRDLRVEAGIAVAAKVAKGLTLALRLEGIVSTLAIREGRPYRDWLAANVATGLQFDFERVAARLYVAADVVPWSAGQWGGLRGTFDLFVTWGDARREGMSWARNDPPPEPARSPRPEPTAVAEAADTVPPARPPAAAAAAAPGPMYAGPGVPIPVFSDPAQAFQDACDAIALANGRYLGPALAARGLETLQEIVVGTAAGVGLTMMIMATGTYYSLSVAAVAKFLAWLGVTSLSLIGSEKVRQIEDAFGPFFLTVMTAHGDKDRIDLAAQQYADAVAVVSGVAVEALFLAAATRGVDSVIRQIKGSPLAQKLGLLLRAWLAAGAQRIRAEWARAVKPEALRIQVRPDTDLRGGAPYGSRGMIRPPARPRNPALGEGPEADAVRPVTKQRAGIVRPDRHHVLPQKYRAWFEEHGFTGEMDIDNFCVEVEASSHQASHGGGNRALARKWKDEWNNAVMKELMKQEARIGRKLTPEDVLKLVRPLMKKHCIDSPFVSYRGD